MNQYEKKAHQLYEALVTYMTQSLRRGLTSQEQHLIMEGARDFILPAKGSTTIVDDEIFGLATEDYLKTLSKIIKRGNKSMREIKHYIEKNQKETISDFHRYINRMQLDLDIEKVVTEIPDKHDKHHHHHHDTTVPSEESEVIKLVDMMLRESEKIAEHEEKDWRHALKKIEKEISSIEKSQKKWRKDLAEKIAEILPDSKSGPAQTSKT